MSKSVSEATRRRIQGPTDPGEMPSYPISEVAHFLWVKDKSVRRWATGEVGRKPVIRVADPAHRLLSFLNLSELHVLSALRDQNVPLRVIRRSVNYLSGKLPGDPHPLLAMDLLTDGVSIFVDHLGWTSNRETLVNITRDGQLAMRSLFEAHLKRIERDLNTQDVLRLYPFAWRVRSAEDAESQPRPIAVDPTVSFGRPVLAGTRIPTSEIAGRISAGEPMKSIAKDMHLELDQVEAALRYHIKAA
jgi:uncharacterized protein (DUF433 family)